ncbi:hypothetical protein NML43_11465 [Rhodopseudomonas palustris]|uniref:hypothetical protein n=1 Tax=Rhodopseudomonas palustris TaxID=1076 RepID=UPI0020CF88EB|nr:hypothetical protein [Rhodopseudomonas palustris]MCP9627707.1 hypothetical protein [Rhodopseudomonas palustris]
MLKTIILFAGRADYQHALSLLLREHNPGLSIWTDVSAEDLDLLEPEVLQHSRLVCFGDTLPLAERVVEQLGHGAYQFYAAPLQHPGLPPRTAAEAADDAPCVSVIAKAIGRHPAFDQIIGIETFTLPPSDEAAKRDRIAFTRLAHMFWRMSHALACEPTLANAGHAPSRWC